MSRLRLVALALLLIGTVAACSSSPAASATDEPTPTEEPTPTPTESAIALPSLDLPSDDAELEALIPDDLGLSKGSMKGDNFLDEAPDGGAAARAFFEDIGVDPSEISVAFGFGISSGIFVQIFRAPGADTDALVQGYKDATDEERDAPLQWSAANVGGKDVETAVDPATDVTYYLYGVSDLVIVVSAPDEAAAADILSGMP